MPVPVANSYALLHHRVARVISDGSKKEVRRIHTAAVVAGMADQHPCRYRSDVKFVADTVSPSRSTVGVNLSVAVLLNVSEPQPAGVGALNLLIKPVN